MSKFQCTQPPSCRALRSLVQPLAGFAARAATSPPPVTDDALAWLAAFSTLSHGSGCVGVLFRFIGQLESSLSDADALRALSIASLPLATIPKLVLSLVVSQGSLTGSAALLAEVKEALYCSAVAVDEVLSFPRPAPTALSPRALAAARATSISDKVLLNFLQTMVEACERLCALQGGGCWGLLGWLQLLLGLGCASAG